MKNLKIENCSISEINAELVKLGIKLKVANIPQNNKIEFNEHHDYDRGIHLYYLGRKYNYDELRLKLMWYQMLSHNKFIHEDSIYILARKDLIMYCFDKTVVIEKMPSSLTEITIFE